MKKEIQAGDYELIAESLECSYDYVRRILTGERPEKTQLAKNIKAAYKRVIATRRMLKTSLVKFSLLFLPYNIALL